MGADQYLLPRLGAQARILLDRFVASGAGGVDRRDTDDWVLSRLVQLRYVEESTLGDTTFVCTAAGRHRWQIEMMADERRGAKPSSIPGMFSPDRWSVMSRDGSIRLGGPSEGVPAHNPGGTATQSSPA